MAVNLNFPQFYAQEDALITTRPHLRGSRVFNEALETFLESSHQIAQEILAPERLEGYHRDRRCIGRVSCNSYVFAPVVVGGATYHVGGTGYSRGRGDDRPSDGLRVFAGVIGAVFGGYALFKIGQAISSNREAGKELDEVTEFRGRIAEWKADWRMLTRDQRGENAILSKVEKIAECRKNIFARIRSKAHADIALLVVVIASAVLAIVGAICASFVSLMVALGVGLAAGGAMLFKWGLDSNTKGHTSDAKEIERNVQALWAIQVREGIREGVRGRAGGLGGREV